MAAKDVVLLLERSPSTKRSSNRKERWDKTPPTSGNVYDSNPEVDFVLRSPLTSFQSKADIIKEIKASSQFLMLGRDSKLVFHRNTAEDRVKITRKARANGELIITNDCTYKVIDRRQSRQLYEGLLVGRSSSMIGALPGPLKRRLQHLQSSSSIAPSSAAIPSTASWDIY